MNRVAWMLYLSLQRGDPYEPKWFEESLDIAMREQVGLDFVIWGAVREILDNMEQGKYPSPLATS